MERVVPKACRGAARRLSVWLILSAGVFRHSGPGMNHPDNLFKVKKILGSFNKTSFDWIVVEVFDPTSMFSFVAYPAVVE